MHILINQKMLRHLEKYIQTKEDLADIERQLNDYDNVQQLIDIIKNIFSHLISKLESRNSSKTSAY